MTDDVLTPILPPDGLSAEDAAVFERVWRRVMAVREPQPEQGALVPQMPTEAPATMGQTDGLLEYIRTQSEGWRMTQSLARRAGGSMARVLSGMAADERRQLARLAAAWYILTGQRWRPAEGKATPTPTPDLMAGLRQRYLHLQQSANRLERAEEDDMGALYAELAVHNRENAKLILRLLEQMQL